jgi:hypothetical protein
MYVSQEEMAMAVEWKTHCWFVYWEINGKHKDELKSSSDYGARTLFTCAEYNYLMTISDNKDYLSLTLNFNEKGI